MRPALCQAITGLENWSCTACMQRLLTCGRHVCSEKDCNADDGTLFWGDVSPRRRAARLLGNFDDFWANIAAIRQ